MKDKMDDVVIFSLNASKKLTKNICEKLGVEEGKIDIRHFSDGEMIVELLETVREKTVYIVQSTNNPVSQNLMELLIAIDAAKRAFAKKIHVVIPYFGYARQDRKARPRQPITARLVAELIQAAGATSIMTVEVHSRQTMGFFNIPADDLTVIGKIAGYFKKNKLNNNMVVVSPDHGGVKRARYLAEILGTPIAIIDKRRVVDNEAEAMNLIGEVRGKDVVIIDDMVDTGGTLVSGVEMLKSHGALEVYAAVAHPVLSGKAIERLENSSITKFICTDTIELSEEKKIEKIEVVSIADMIADIIKANVEGRSITEVIRRYRDLEYTDK